VLSIGAKDVKLGFEESYATFDCGSQQARAKALDQTGATA